MHLEVSSKLFPGLAVVGDFFLHLHELHELKKEGKREAFDECGRMEERSCVGEEGVPVRREPRDPLRLARRAVVAIGLN